MSLAPRDGETGPKKALSECESTTAVMRVKREVPVAAGNVREDAISSVISATNMIHTNQ